MTLIYYLIGGYLLGSIPFGLIIGKLRGVDVRNTGSGNIGATNVTRSAGWLAGSISMILDISKGFVPVLVASSLGFEPWQVVCIGLAVFLGHCWSVFLLFKGGKGISTSLGIVLALDWRLGLACAVVWLIIVLVWKFVSLASIITISLIPFGFLLTHFDILQFLSLIGIAIIVVIKHIPNIRRLVDGEEYKIGEKALVHVNSS
jgi:acyl phosphate:glycerol-3-phosphate acyltransferase